MAKPSSPRSKPLSSLLAFAVAALVVSVAESAHAEAPPTPAPGWVAIPGLPAFSFPPLPQGLPALPPLAQWTQGGFPTLDPSAWNRVLTEMQSCPPIEIAPGVRFPVPCLKSTPVDAGKNPRRYYPVLPLPPQVSLAGWGLESPVRDQGGTGTCWAFALAGAAETALRRTGNRDLVSTMHIVSTYSQDRAAYSDGNGARRAVGSESAWPYDPVRACLLNDVTDHDYACESNYRVPAGSWRSSPQMVSEVAAADAGGRYVITREYVSGDPDEHATLLAQGRAIVLSIGVDSHAWGWDGVKGGTLPEYVNADRGGHAVLLTGYIVTPSGRFFRVKNSWGTKWGNGGAVWLGESNLRRHFMGASIVTVNAVR